VHYARRPEPQIKCDPNELQRINWARTIWAFLCHRTQRFSFFLPSPPLPTHLQTSWPSCLTRRCSFNPAGSWPALSLSLFLSLFPFSFFSFFLFFFYASGSLAVSKSAHRACGINWPFPICIYISISAAMGFHRSSSARNTK